MKIYPECEFRYNPIGYELCNYGNGGVPEHKRKIAVCCANYCPLGKYPEFEKITLQQAYERDMRKIDVATRDMAINKPARPGE